MNKILVQLAVLLCLSAHVASKAGGRGRSRGGGGKGGRRGFGGSIGSSKARTAAVALAGGVVGYNGGQIARRINNGSSSMFYPSYNRHYYFGNRYYSSRETSSDVFVCRYEISVYDEFFNLTYADGRSRVTEVVYECNSGQYCCDGLDCCNNGISVWVEFLLVMGGLGLFTGCCYCFAYYYGPKHLKKVEDKPGDDNQPFNCSQSETRPYYNQKDHDTSTSAGQPTATDPLLPVYGRTVERAEF